MNAASSTASLEDLESSFLARRHKLLIGGEWVDSRSGKTFSTVNPANGRVLAEVAEGAAADVDAAVVAARKSFEAGPWTSKMNAAARARMIFKLADLLEARAEEFALIEALDNGKPMEGARKVDVASAVEMLRYNAGWASKLTGETIPVASGDKSLFYTVREPIGVVGLIVPWNFPLAMAVTKLAPALAAGCTVVLKPDEKTPLSAIRLGELCQEVGFPPGVINVITGYGETVGAAMSAHQAIDKISFTGSTETGKAIVRAATGNLKRLTLELGGKSPIVIFPDADLDRAATSAAYGIFMNSGQVCVASSRLYAHASVFDRIVEAIAAQAARFKIGPGTEPGSDMGPVISALHRERILRYVHEGARSGASLVCGGKSIGDQGYFMEPTILTNTSPESLAVREEIFGPVLCAMRFDAEDLERIAAEANASSYGLAAYVWTRDLSTAHKMARKIKAGNISINGASFAASVPFGGYKQSGWGRENGREGVEAFTELKSVAIAL